MWWSKLNLDILSMYLQYEYHPPRSVCTNTQVVTGLERAQAISKAAQKYLSKKPGLVTTEEKESLRVVRDDELTRPDITGSASVDIDDDLDWGTVPLDRDFFLKSNIDS